ncbi:MAG TPA: DUF1361 domain-containing protein [Armatimonadota bacterium]|jgi:uncharacterized membrane protein
MIWDLDAWHWVLWNVFLAAIPVVTGYVISIGATQFSIRRRTIPLAAWLPLLAVWFVFLPNTCYLLTEWRHFLMDDQMPSLLARADQDPAEMLNVAKWGLFFLLYSGIGAAAFILAIRPIHQLLRRLRVPGWIPGAPFFFLMSFGVYLGLIVRLNSWDILHRPFHVWDETVQAFGRFRLMEAVVVFAVLLWLLYWLGDLIADGLAYRVKQRSGAPGSVHQGETINVEQQ